MNAIINAIKEIHFNIPEEVINLAFLENYYRVNTILSVDEIIMAKLIRPKILVDCNLVGGVDINVPFDSTMIKPVDNNNTNKFIIEVPKTLTNGCSIVTVGNILATSALYTTSGYSNIGNTWYNGFNNFNVSPALSAGMKVMNSVSDLNIIQTSRTEVIGENIILVEEPTQLMYGGIIKCTVENSKNLENINPRSYISFGDLVVIAAKAYIYNKLRIKIDKGFVLGGHEVSSIKDTIDEYSDAANMYKEELVKWRKIAFLNNNISKAAYIRSMLPNV